MNKRQKGYIYSAAASFSYGMNPLFALPLFKAGLGVNSILFYRYFFAVIIYFVWLKFFKNKSLKINIKELLFTFISAMFFGASSLTLFASFKYIDSGIACTILFIYPLLVALIMRLFFNEKLTKTAIFAIILTFGGIILLYKGKNGLDLNITGICYILISAIVYAIYIVIVKVNKTLKHMNTEKLTFYVMLFSLFLFIYNLKFCTNLQIIPKPMLWIYPIGLALFPTIISIETLTIGIKLIGPTPTAILGALEPLTAIFFGVLFFHEQLTQRIIIGVIAILSGVFLIILKKK